VRKRERIQDNKKRMRVKRRGWKLSSLGGEEGALVNGKTGVGLWGFGFVVPRGRRGEKN